MRTPTLLTILLLPLIVAAISAAITWVLKEAKHRTALAAAEQEKRQKVLDAEAEFQRRIDAAPRQYVRELDRLIRVAVEEGPQKAVLNAGAIVEARNSLRSSLVSISTQLNSQIDELALNIGQSIRILQDTARHPFGKVNPREVFQTIEVLSRVWPARMLEMEVAIRKILVELGLTPTPDSAGSGGARSPSSLSGTSGGSAGQSGAGSVNTDNQELEERRDPPDEMTLGT